MDYQSKICSRRCDVSCVTGLIDAEKLIKLEKYYEKLLCSNSKSLLRKHLTRKIYDTLKFRRCYSGVTLLECIRSGLENYDTKVGVHAPEPDAYKYFSPIFIPIIEEYHLGFKETDVHPIDRWGNMQIIENVDRDRTCVKSVRISCSRNLKGFPFHPLLETEDYRTIQKLIVKTLKKLPPELEGTYYPLARLTDKEENRLRKNNLLFGNDDDSLRSAKAYNCWPHGRGIFYNNDQNFAVWVNAEDHMRVMTMEKSGDVGNVYRRIYNVLKALSERLEFCVDKRLGYVTFRPENLGTGMEICAVIKVCHLWRNKLIFKTIADRNKLEIKRQPGSHPRGVCYYQVSNKCTLGKTEYELVNDVCNGLVQIIKTELEMTVKDMEAELQRQKELANKEE